MSISNFLSPVLLKPNYSTFIICFQISDDEDDTHPNIDTASLFRWRHQARVQRMEETKNEKDKYLQQIERFERQYRNELIYYVLNSVRQMLLRVYLLHGVNRNSVFMSNVT